ncbi:MAG: class I poly(R)-hydroxyalkanoic acid synthase, partial [Gammaproteobacteria bacterium PRO9]|nr:class I poly(R)-hydroxyalkanoic acid synthase [Gammaproteobacteria bacterium PRO9]
MRFAVSVSQPKPEATPADPVALARELNELTGKAQAMFAELMKVPAERAAFGLAAPPNPDPLNVAPAMTEAVQRLGMDPAKLVQANLQLWQQHMLLWQQMAATFAAGRPGAPAREPVAEPDPGDRRFRDPEWNSNPFFDYLKQSYLITSRWLVDTMSTVAGLDRQTAHKVDFYTRQFADAFSPSNFPWSNPEVLRETLATGGANLRKGFENFQRDLEHGKGKLNITMTDPAAFELGRDLAATPGKVVFRNDLIELLQYEPVTEQVHRTPILMVPAWINKYYILDLAPGKSLVAWLLGQGYTVFVVSWVNPDESRADKEFEHYLTEGV